MVVYTGLAFVVGGFLRVHYLAPLVTKNPNVSATAWIMGQYGTEGGQVAFTGLAPMQLLNQLCPPVATTNGKILPPPGTPQQCLIQHGYTLVTSYQPASRFWAFQWIEGGWLLALSVLLLAATVWMVRRRAT